MHIVTRHETHEHADYAARVWELLADQVDYQDLRRLYAADERTEGTIDGMFKAGATEQDTADQIMRDEF